MITDFDDYLIHQAALPINQMGVPNRNAYDRYWFNGFDQDGGFTFEIGFGQYPNRFVQDAHFTVVVDGIQHSFHASRRIADGDMTPIRPGKSYRDEFSQLAMAMNHMMTLVLTSDSIGVTDQPNRA